MPARSGASRPRTGPRASCNSGSSTTSRRYLMRQASDQRNTEGKALPMKRWHLILTAILLASAVGLAQGGRGQQPNAGRQGGQGGGRGAGGNGGGRGPQSTAGLTVVDGWGHPANDRVAGGTLPR